MFFGTHTPRLDDKGRIVLPAKFRDALVEGLVVTRGQDRCLYVWPQADFEQMTARLSQHAGRGRADRSYVRMLYSGASDERPDKQGRVTIPPALRDYARLERECVVIGAMDKIEIWDAAAWQQYMADHEDAFSDLDEEVAVTES
ncbi:MAG TPA: division/cell wall cluster transcriptional repressor MraZ [Nocardioidaceae bacterium]|nr:division/cell wall cluster transcriptional repressor MraZ [Nocardioidaceae bacterium]